MMKQNLSYKMVLHRLNNYIAINLKNRSDTILRLWAGQCENIIAQRFRRGQQMLSLYTKIWEDRALKELFLRLRRQVWMWIVTNQKNKINLCEQRVFISLCLWNAQ